MKAGGSPFASVAYREDRPTGFRGRIYKASSAGRCSRNGVPAEKHPSMVAATV